MKRTEIRLLMLAVAFSILAAACGSDNDAQEGAAVRSFTDANQSATDGADLSTEGLSADGLSSEGLSAEGTPTVEDPDEDPGEEEAAGQMVDEATNEALNDDGESDCGDDAVLCVGLITNLGVPSADPLNQAAMDSVQTLASSMDASVEIVEANGSADYASAVAAFTEQNHDVIVTVGSGFAEATRAAATANRGTYFVGIDQHQETEVPNLVGLVFANDVLGFMAGALAGLVTETGIVAQVLGTDLVEPVIELKEGFEAGVEYTNSGADVISTYHPGTVELAFADPEWGASIAREALSSGADVVFGAGGTTANGALEEVAKEQGLALCIGADADQWNALPEAKPCLVTSAVKLVGPGLVEIMAAWENGSPVSGNFFGPVGLADYRDFASVINQEAQAFIAELIPQITAGELPIDSG